MNRNVDNNVTKNFYSRNTEGGRNIMKDYNLKEIMEFIENKSLCHFKEFNDNGILVDEYYSPLVGFKIDPKTEEGLFISDEGTEWKYYKKADKKEINRFIIDLRLYYPPNTMNIEDLREYLIDAVMNTPNIVLDNLSIEEIKNNRAEDDEYKMGDK